MKKVFLAVALMFLAIGVGKVALADEHPGAEHSGMTLHGFYIEPNVSAVIPFDDDLDTTVFAGGKVGYQWNEYLALEIESGWAEFDEDEGSDDDDLTVVPLLFNARLNLWPGVYMVDPYLFGGIGAAFLSGDDDADDDTSFAGQVGGGVEYHINEWLSAYIDLRVLLADSGDDDAADDINSFLAGGGLVWRF